MPLGLQLFEPRYLQMLEDISAGDGRFGVVMITRGSEVGGADERAEVGTVAQVVASARTPDGRWMVEAVGTDRYRVTQWLPDDPYPRAEVEPWTQLMGDSVAERLSTARNRFDTFLTLASELGADTSGVDVGDTGADALYGMAVAAPVSTHDRYRILAAPNIGEATEILTDALEGLIDVVRFRLSER